ncbi:UNVERIFIED_CONTAM: Histone-lysine N-methyltransferase ASHH2 [Sesamum latifolium]|uniref:Histone-lysine N-methyltransferase ASHH2 n=1 Tax=Sesamum latifolium TaxID=2727402 RepID=A0AAW2WA62_9LAMI
MGVSIENHCSDVGTSPDSEVINSVPDGSFCEKDLPDIHDSPIMSKEYVPPSDVSSLILSREKFKKGKKTDKLLLVGNCTLEGKQTGGQTTDTAKLSMPLVEFSSLRLPHSKCKKGKKNKLHEVGDLSVYGKLTGADTTNNAEVPADHGVGQKVGDASMITTVKPCSDGAETNACSGLVAASVSSNSPVHDKLIPCKNGRKLPKCSRAKGVRKARSGILDLSGETNKASKRKGKKSNVGGKHQATEEVGASGAVSGVESLLAAGNQESSDLGETADFSKDISAPRRLKGVRAAASDIIGEDWLGDLHITISLESVLRARIKTCKDNTDKDFADCSIPQEKSNSEINEELEISDASCEEDACGNFLKSKQYRPKVAQQASWSLIKTNLFLHRSRKTQTIDEVMVCHCKPPSDGRMGCGAKCLNRMLNIECVQGTCPCGELCSNQQFQKRKYAKLKWFRCGKKGYGLQALEDISEGQFLIEYVGEVLDVHAYEARQREYALNGHKHFYFMTLNGSEVHQIARNFRDRWIPRHLRKNCCMERDDGKIEFHHQHFSYGGLSLSYNHLCDGGAKPSEQINTPEMQSAAASGTVETSAPDLPSALGTSCGNNTTKTRKRKSRWDNPVEEHRPSRSRTNMAGDEKPNADEDAPPGFSSPCNGGHRVQFGAASTTVNHQESETCIKQHPVDIISGDSQLRFVAHMPLSYGISYSVMQQFGVRKAETSDCWTVAPGVPFHPFPPLPSYPHSKEELPTSAAGCASFSETAEKIEQNNDTCVTYHTGQIHPGICSIDPPEQNVSVANGPPDFQQGGLCSLGRKYFRQQKWNHPKLAPPWVRMRNGWGHAGNNARNVPPGLGLGNGPNEFRNSYNSENVNWRGVS